MARITGFNQLIDDRLRQLCLIPDLLPGRVIEVRSKPLRRSTRGFSSGREEVTEAHRLFVGLAHLDPLRLLENYETGDFDPKQLSRLKRTFATDEQRRQWAILMATRLLGAIEAAAGESGMKSVWVSEGLDFAKMKELLAVPDDHLIIGLLAISGEVIEEESPEFNSPLLDYDGFFGSL